MTELDKFFLLLVNVTVIVSSHEAKEEVSSRIWNGKNTLTIHVEYYYMVYQILVEGGPEGANPHPCGGALIDRHWVLSAGHCLVSRSRKMHAESGLIRFNISDLKGGTDVHSWVVHPLLYDFEGKFDLLLIRLKNRSFRQPISLPLPGDDRSYLDKAKNAKLVSIGPNHEDDIRNKANGLSLQTTKTSLSHSTCHVHDSGDGRWLNARYLGPYVNCITFPAVLDLRNNAFLLCQDSGSLSVIETNGEEVLQGIIGLTPDPPCNFRDRAFNFRKKEAQEIVRIEPQMAFILHTIDINSDSHQLNTTMELWMAYPHILSRLLPAD